jgi:hypothetical protein
MSQSSSPTLAPPGAGLPRFERFVANLMVHWSIKRSTRESSEATIAEERDKILSLVRDRSEADLSQRVLIQRLRGLEDSSRYWSLLMVLDHLRIVNKQIAGVMLLLCAGRVPKVKGDTAKVKPSHEVTLDVIESFLQGCDDLISSVASQADLNTNAKSAHPWFGPMNAAGWHFMVGMHMTLHRKQMERIIAGLT